MLHTTANTVDIFQVRIFSLDGRFEINTEVSTVENSKLLSLPNPKCEELEDKDTKDLLPIHLMLGASDYAKIKTRTALKIGKNWRAYYRTYHIWTDNNVIWGRK